MKIECSFPMGIRLWRWWCANGPRSGSGGTIGGSFFLRRLREFYSAIPGKMSDIGRVRINGERDLYLDTLDLRTFHVVLPQLKDGDRELLLARVLTPPTGVFVDVGANIGVLSLLALSESVNAVYSFEPNPEMMTRLRMTRSASPLAQRWHLLGSAVGATRDRLKLHVDRQFSGTASLIQAWQRPGVQMVDVVVVALDDWLREENPLSVDVLKMDVEGWEFAVLEGAQNLLRRHQPFVWFEHNLPALQRSGLGAKRVLDSLQQLGYEMFFDIGRLPDQQPLSRREVDEIANARVNLLAIPEPRREDFSVRVLPQFRRLRGQDAG